MEKYLWWLYKNLKFIRLQESKNKVFGIIQWIIKTVRKDYSINRVILKWIPKNIPCSSIKPDRIVSKNWILLADRTLWSISKWAPKHIRWKLTYHKWAINRLICVSFRKIEFLVPSYLYADELGHAQINQRVLRMQTVVRFVV